ncbi:hypothetical protein L1D51_12240 [Pseudoalteromonas shioyasakiensis]|uniref:hypothetical protein n=1 Tax=Pseudoalteromonas shioyasakiensis TaxID=1190813 RepID=UPI001EFC5789|nr:hypothetical protein [Pseudoalteromonas shioyasakiensis]MCG9734763.1 hypothetical protein [Pseudoalteromonas shioyasakiensis]
MVNIDLILKGYDEAFLRLRTQRDDAKISGDSKSLYIPLVETLGWADVIEEFFDERFGKDWMLKLPNSKSDYEQVILGFRYARNVVHHRWAVAVELDSKIPLFQDWCWKLTLESTRPQPKNRAAYESKLAGRALRHTFKDLHKIYGSARKYLVD